MLTAEDWRELYRCEDLMQARAVATSIAGMEFDVRMRALGTAINTGHDYDQRDEHDDDPSDGPYVIEVRPVDWTQLVDVLAEIIQEQADFDALLASRRDQQARRMRLMLIAAAAILAALAGNAMLHQCEHDPPAPR